jgi:16S rRNA (guanine527-N7)-methyltransferase
MMKSLADTAKEHFDITLGASQVDALAFYQAQLLDWNANRMNLTAITEPEAVQIRHFLDSMSIVQVMGFDEGDRLIDVGTGAGFPGLVLAIVFPQLDVTLLDSTKKKLGFLDFVIGELGLKNVRTLHMRAEEAGKSKKHREQYDIVTARAVARLPVLAEYILPLAKIGGFCIAMKGETALQELDDAKRALYVLGGEAMPPAEVHLPDVEHTHYLVTIQKTQKTPKAYPRKAGTPNKQPIGMPEKDNNQQGQSS